MRLSAKSIDVASCILCLCSILCWVNILEISRHYDRESAIHEFPSFPFIPQEKSVARLLQSNKTNDIFPQNLTNFTKIDGNQAEVLQLDRQINNRTSCKCVRCTRDPLCGRLWQGNQAYGNTQKDVHQLPIHLVVSFCKGDLSFIPAMTEDFNIASIHIISKCDREVRGLPSTATVEVLPNVGRCDHSYAHYITTVLDQKVALANSTEHEDDSIVVFLKDNAGASNLHQAGRWNSFYNMIHVASSDAGFSCGMIPEVMFKRRPIYWISAHFEVKTILQFTISQYASVGQHYDKDKVVFKSQFPTLGEFYDHLGADPLQRDIVQVCFGGVFAASLKQIRRQRMDVWRTLEEALSRGDNIQEGHYAERSWGMLLSPPLHQYQVDALWKYSSKVLEMGYHKRFGDVRINQAVLGALVSRVDRKKDKFLFTRRMKCETSRHCWE